MKNKFLVVAVCVMAAALTGGLTAWAVLRSNEDQSVNSGQIHTPAANFDGAGNHFTAYTADGYPDLTYAAENAVKAVVSIIRTDEVEHPFQQLFREEQSGSGSGVIIGSDGYIVTNHHVVSGASKLEVKLPDGKTYEGELIGTDADTEVALVKIDATDLPALQFGSSDALRLGEWVLAIGSPYQLQSTITAGIVSAKARSLGAIQTSGNGGVESFIQTDAAVNPGNSGGALVNAKGELVGINTLILSRTGSYAGYSFAVPETIVRKVVSDLKEYGAVQRGLIGITYQPTDEGVVVREVMEGGAAESAGIKSGDIITEIDGIAISAGSTTIAEVVSRKRPGDVVKISVKRDGKVKQFDVTLRNRAGKIELLAREAFDAVSSLAGEFADITLSDKQKQQLGIDAGVQVTAVGRGGILERARVERGYIITQINGRKIRSVGDLYKVNQRITSIEGVYPNGRSVTYSLVE